MIDLNKKRSTYNDSLLGRMNRKVSIYSVTETTDSQGGGTETATLVRTVWAYIEPMTGNRQLQYSQLISGKPYDIVIQYMSDVTLTEGYYLVWGSKTLHIHSVRNTDNRFFEVVAWEKTTA